MPALELFAKNELGMLTYTVLQIEGGLEPLLGFTKGCAPDYTVYYDEEFKCVSRYYAIYKEDLYWCTGYSMGVVFKFDSMEVIYMFIYKRT